MIITASDRDSKSSNIVTDTAASSVSTLSPPASRPPAYSSQVYSPLYHQQLPPSHSLPSPMLTPRQSSSAAWRFFKALFVAGIIYSVFGILVQSVIVLAKSTLTIEGSNLGPEASDGQIVHCFNYKAPEGSLVDTSQQVPMITYGEDWPLSVDLSYTIDSNSSVVFLFSRGSYGSGEVTYELSDKASSSDKIEIEIKMSYYTEAILARTQVCLLDRDGGRGIGFFTPKRMFGTPGMYKRIRFTTVVRFPRLDQPLIINSLESKLNIWSQHMSSLEGQTLFNKVSLHSSNSPITIDAISASSGNFETSNAPITGSFNVSDGLKLHTSNAPVNAKVRLENDPTTKPTTLDIRTSNAMIDASLALVSTNVYADSPASFSVSTKTSNGRLIVTLPEAPSTRISPFYVLNFVGKTSNMPITATLHPTYEGSLSLSSSIFSPKLTFGSPSDPTGKSRNRSVVIRKVVGKTLEADAWWGEKYAAQKGTVELRTSNAYNDVHLL